MTREALVDRSQCLVPKRWLGRSAEQLIGWSDSAKDGESFVGIDARGVRPQP